MNPNVDAYIEQSVKWPAEMAELRQILDEDPSLRTAFSALTPGRQREYNLYFSDAKQAKTREARIDKYVEKILGWQGLSRPMTITVDDETRVSCGTLVARNGQEQRDLLYGPQRWSSASA